VPQIFAERHDDVNDEQVLGIGEEAHAGDEHDLPVMIGDFGVIRFRKIATVPGK